MKAQDETQIKEKLDAISRWRASGQDRVQWARGNGIDSKQLKGWLSNEGHWRVRLAGLPIATRQSPKVKRSKEKVAAPNGFMAVKLSQLERSDGGVCIRVELRDVGAMLHWPISHSAELTQWLAALRGGHGAQT